jgi:hypothetical protein
VRSDKTSYLPHRGVVKMESLTTKLRIVIDASAHETNCLSLNDNLHAGPKKGPDLLDVLLNFRTHRIALMGDVEKAFPQVIISTEDRDALRILWLDENEKLIEYRFTRNYFGLNCSSFILEFILSRILQKFRTVYPDIVNSIEKGHYVDDLLSGCNSVEDAKDFYQKSREILLDGSFVIRKWVSSCPEVRKFLKEKPDALETCQRRS